MKNITDYQDTDTKKKKLVDLLHTYKQQTKVGQTESVSTLVNYLL